MIHFDKCSKFYDDFGEQKIIEKVINDFTLRTNLNTLQTVYIFNAIPNRPIAEGLTLPIINSSLCTMQLELYFSDNLFDKFFLPLNKEALHIIHHEFCHCKACELIYSKSTAFEFHLLGEEQHTREELIFDLAFFLYGEYYACYHSYASYIDLNTKVLLKDYAKKAHQDLDVFKVLLSDIDDNSIANAYYLTNKNIKKLFYHFVHELAYYHASDKTILSKEISELINMPKTEFGSWSLLVESKILELNTIGIENLTYDMYIDLGETIFSVYNNYGIKITNKDGSIHFETM